MMKWRECKCKGFWNFEKKIIIEKIEIFEEGEKIRKNLEKGEVREGEKRNEVKKERNEKT